MESNITRYLFDANAIRRLSYKTISDKRNANTVLETTENIITELGDRSIQKQGLFTVCVFDAVVYEKMSTLLAMQQSVRDLLDYYNNKGVGDVGILAYALVADEGKLIKDVTILVTDDRGVVNACKELDLNYVSTSQFGA